MRAVRAWWSSHRHVRQDWLLIFLLGAGSGFYVAVVQGGLQPDVSRQERAAWRASQAQWSNERQALHAEVGRLRDETQRAKAWINSQQQTLTLSHARLADANSERHVCERLLDTLMAARKR